jgi:hypothetical protein
MAQVRKWKTVDTSYLFPGELLHIDFAFWDLISRHGFSAMRVAIYANTCKLWLFCTASKKAPLHILRWIFSNLRREYEAHICCCSYFSF